MDCVDSPRGHHPLAGHQTRLWGRGRRGVLRAGSLVRRRRGLRGGTSPTSPTPWPPIAALAHAERAFWTDCRPPPRSATSRACPHESNSARAGPRSTTACCSISSQRNGGGFPAFSWSTTRKRPPTAWPGFHSRVVVSSGAIEALSDDELAAVLAHERAHLHARHDLVLFPFRSLCLGLARLRSPRRGVTATCEGWSRWQQTTARGVSVSPAPSLVPSAGWRRPAFRRSRSAQAPTPGRPGGASALAPPERQAGGPRIWAFVALRPCAPPRRLLLPSGGR